jgi:hypothetical protein
VGRAIVWGSIYVVGPALKRSDILTGHDDLETHIPLLVTMHDKSILKREDMDWSNGKMISCNVTSGQGVFRFGKPDGSPSDVNVAGICGHKRMVHVPSLLQLSQLGQKGENFVTVVPTGTFEGFAPTMGGEKVMVGGTWTVARKDGRKRDAYRMLAEDQVIVELYRADD